MLRRQILGGLATAAGLWACRSGRPVPRQTGPIAAVAFDLFTLFDPRGVDRALEVIVPGQGNAIADAWRARQFQYCWLRAASGTYRDFHAITADALAFVLAARGLAIPASTQHDLVEVYTRLEPWPDAIDVLGELRARRLRLAPLANFTPSMIERLLGHARMLELFDARFSTDAVRTFKPHPGAYALAAHGFGLASAQVAFAAFGGWDAAGAAWAGMPTFWVNRLGVPREELGASHAEGPDLRALAAWLPA